MDRDQNQPLNCEQAKARLREAAHRASPYAYVASHPGQSVLIAMAVGFLGGQFRLSQIINSNLTQQLLPLFISHWVNPKRSSARVENKSCCHKTR